MEKVGVLVVAYGSREAAMIDALSRSDYKINFYIADKQRNPYNLEIAKVHKVIPDLDVDKIVRFAEKYKREIDFGIVGSEGPIINGIRDEMEGKLEIPMICPTKEYALEESKVRQRELIEKVYPKANPKFRVFDPRKYNSIEEAKKDLYPWLNEFNNEVAVKLDKPGFGKGVGVWGDHFNTHEKLFEHFESIYKTGGTVIIEEKVSGEEFSGQFFNDIITPFVRDYKRAFNGDSGPNTGGMGSYKDTNYLLPFMEQKDMDEAIRIQKAIFGELGEEGKRGIFYPAYICTEDGVKILEINNRPGDPEMINLMPVLKDDFVDVCFKTIEGSLKTINFEPKATVVTYAVPMTYGGRDPNYKEVTKVEYLKEAKKLFRKYGDNIRFYPGSMELRNDGLYALNSRTICSVGIGDDIPEARKISLEGINAIKTTEGRLWNRKDIASNEHIQKSIKNMKRIRKF